MEPQLAPLASIFDLNTDLLLNCLDGLSDAEARERLAGGGNSITFLAAHLTDTRHFLAARMGQPLRNPMVRYLAEARSIEDIAEWPSLAEIRSGWCQVSAHLKSAFNASSAADLARQNTHRFPISDASQLGMIAFLVQHDAYHVGQMAFVRRQLGHPPMAYRRGATGSP
jgi:uncharacterized damage-inducible protein DinB